MQTYTVNDFICLSLFVYSCLTSKGPALLSYLPWCGAYSVGHAYYFSANFLRGTIIFFKAINKLSDRLFETVHLFYWLKTHHRHTQHFF